MVGRDRDRLKALLRERSLMFGDFTLASGQKSTFYFDSKRTTLHAEGALLTAHEFLHVLDREGLEPSAIGGMTLGADPIVCPIAAVSAQLGRPVDAFIVRKEAKEHGTARPIEGMLDEGAEVVVIDDVVTTGGSTVRAIEAVEAAGHRVIGVLCLVDREQGGAERLSRWGFHPLFRRSEIFDDLGS